MQLKPKAKYALRLVAVLLGSVFLWGCVMNHPVVDGSDPNIQPIASGGLRFIQGWTDHKRGTKDKPKKTKITKKDVDFTLNVVSKEADWWRLRIYHLDKNGVSTLLKDPGCGHGNLRQAQRVPQKEGKEAWSCKNLPKKGKIRLSLQYHLGSDPRYIVKMDERYFSLDRK